MSLNSKDNALKEAEELLAVKDRRIKELERLLLKAQMLLHNAGVTNDITGSCDERENDRNAKKMKMQINPNRHQEGATVSKNQPDQSLSEGGVGCEQLRTTEYSPTSSQESLDLSTTAAKMTKAVPVNLNVSNSCQSTVVSDTPSSKLLVSDSVSTDMSTRMPATSAVVLASNRSPLATCISPVSGELKPTDHRREGPSPSTSAPRILKNPVTIRDGLPFPPVSSVTTSSSSDSSVSSFGQTDSTQVSPSVNYSCPASLTSVADGTSHSLGIPVSKSKGDVATAQSNTTTSGSSVSTCAAKTETVLTPQTISRSSVSTSDASCVTVLLPRTTWGSFVSASSANAISVSSPGTIVGSSLSPPRTRIVTLSLPATTSGSFSSTASDDIVTGQLPATTCTPCATQDKASAVRESTYPSITVPVASSQVVLADTNSVFSSTDPRMACVVDGDLQNTKVAESAKTVGEANLKSQLGLVAIYFTDDLENFDIAQEETVSMESDATKQDDDDDDDETFVPPANLQLTVNKGCKTRGKSLPDLFDFACQEQNHRLTKRLRQNLCGECGKTFASKRILRRHVKIIHESEQTYLCNVCQKVFRHLHNLNIHKQNQNHFIEGEEHLVKERKLYKCSVCLKTFRQKSNLHDHVRLHSKERPFGCSYCDRRFAQISNCRKHELTHTGKRPYSCDQCHKTFTSSSNLKRHQFAHDQCKNYLCTICGKAFTQKWNLKKHEKKHKDS